MGQVKREAPVFHGCKEGYLYSLIIIMDGKIFGNQTMMYRLVNKENDK